MDETIVKVLVKPRSKKQSLEWIDDHIIICVKATPQRGKANKEIIELLSIYLEIGKSDISIVRGMTSSTKYVKICRITMSKMIEKLNSHQFK